jgi:hypothetical protein
MQRFPLFVLLTAAVALTSVTFVSGQVSVPNSSAGTSAAKSVSRAGDDGWPKEVKSGDTNFRIYQPQMESWDGRNLTALSAIEIRMEGKEGTAYGAARFEAAARIDKAARVVDMENKAQAGLRIPNGGNDERVPEIWRDWSLTVSRFILGAVCAIAESACLRRPIKNNIRSGNRAFAPGSTIAAETDHLRKNEFLGSGSTEVLACI